MSVNAKGIAVAGFELTGHVGRQVTLTTVYTDATNRMTFDAATSNNTGRTRYPCYVELEMLGTVGNCWFILNSGRACVANAASKEIQSVTFTAATAGAAGNLILIGTAISGTSTTATTVVTVTAGGTITATYYAETDAGGTALSTQLDFKAAILAALSDYVTASGGATTVITSVTASALTGGYNADSQSARKVAIDTTATATTGYRVYLLNGKIKVFNEGSEGGIRDIVFLPSATGLQVAALAAYYAEG